MDISHEISIAWSWIKMTFMSRAQDAVTFLPLWSGVILSTFLNVVFFKSLFLNTASLGGWSYGEVMVLLGTFRIVEGTAWGLWVRGGFRRLPTDIERGSFDSNLIRPMNLRVQFIFNNADFFSLAQDLIVGGLLIWYGLSSISGSFNWPMYGLMLLLAFVINYSLVCLFSAVNFWVLVPQISELLSQLLRLGRAPNTVYRGSVRWLLTLVVPLACMYSFPSRALIGNLSVNELLMALAVTFAFWSAGHFVWKFGVRRYESAQG